MIDTPDRRIPDFAERWLEPAFLLLLIALLFVVLSTTGWSRGVGIILWLACAAWGAAYVRSIRAIKSSASKYAQQVQEGQQLLRRVAAVSESYERQKEELLTTVSREVRSAMNASIGFATQALDHSDRPANEAMLGILRSSRRLLATIHELTDPLYLQSTSEPGMYFVSPWRVVEDVLTRINDHASRNRCEVTAYPMGRIPRRLRIDPVSLRQVLTFALMQGVHHSKTGRVVLRLCLRGSDLRFLVSELDRQVSALDDDLAGLDILEPGGEISQSADAASVLRLLPKLNAKIFLPRESGLPVGVELSLPFSDLEDLVEPGDVLTDNLPRKRPMLVGHVLLTEDTEDQRAVLGYYLRSLGLSVDMAVNGQVALDSYVPGRYAAILMDIEMPVRDGYETVRALRQRGCDLPIIAMTADAMPHVRSRCLDAGCSDYLPKPVERAELYHLLARFLPVRQENVDAFGNQPLTGCEMQRLPLTDAAYDSPADREYFHNLLGEYLEQLPRSVSAIGEAVRTHNYSRGETLAHKLKGSAGMYGMPEISELAGLLESAMAEDRESELVTELFEMLNAATRQILADGGKAHRESWDWSKL